MWLCRVDYVAFYEKPIVGLIGFSRPISIRSLWLCKFQSIFLAMGKRQAQKTTLIKQLELLSDQSVNWNQKLLFPSITYHTQQARFPLPFTSAAVVTMDGVGEHTTASISVGVGNSLRTLKTMNFPHSLGLLYSAFTYYTGFK